MTPSHNRLTPREQPSRQQPATALKSSIDIAAGSASSTAHPQQQSRQHSHGRKPHHNRAISSGSAHSKSPQKPQILSPLRALKELFPTWNEDDLQAVLTDVNDDLDTAVMRISEGYATQWSQVKSKKDALKEKEEEFVQASSSSSFKGKPKDEFKSQRGKRLQNSQLQQPRSFYSQDGTNVDIKNSNIPHNKKDRTHKPHPKNASDQQPFQRRGNGNDRPQHSRKNYQQQNTSHQVTPQQDQKIIPGIPKIVDTRKQKPVFEQQNSWSNLVKANTAVKTAVVTVASPAQSSSKTSTNVVTSKVTETTTEVSVSTEEVLSVASTQSTVKAGMVVAESSVSSIAMAAQEVERKEQKNIEAPATSVGSVSRGTKVASSLRQFQNDAAVILPNESTTSSLGLRFGHIQLNDNEAAASSTMTSNSTPTSMQSAAHSEMRPTASTTASMYKKMEDKSESTTSNPRYISSSVQSSTPPMNGYQLHAPYHMMPGMPYDYSEMHSRGYYFPEQSFSSDPATRDNLQKPDSVSGHPANQAPQGFPPMSMGPYYYNPYFMPGQYPGYPSYDHSFMNKGGVYPQHMYGGQSALPKQSQQHQGPVSQGYPYNSHQAAMGMSHHQSAGNMVHDSHKNDYQRQTYNSYGGYNTLHQHQQQQQQQSMYAFQGPTGGKPSSVDRTSSENIYGSAGNGKHFTYSSGTSANGPASSSSSSYFNPLPSNSGNNGQNGPASSSGGFHHHSSGHNSYSSNTLGLSTPASTGPINPAANASASTSASQQQSSIPYHSRNQYWS